LRTNRGPFRVVGCARGSACAHGEDVLGGRPRYRSCTRTGAVRGTSSTSVRLTRTPRSRSSRSLHGSDWPLARAFWTLASGCLRASVSALASRQGARCRSARRGWDTWVMRWAGCTNGSGSPRPAGGDEVFQQLVLARIIEPSSKLDSIRVLQEAGLTAASYPTINRRLPRYAKSKFRQRISAACAAQAGLGPASWCCTTCPLV